MKALIEGLNKAFESRVRLGIMSALMVNESLDFNAMKELLGLTDGNLASHIKALEEEEIISVKKAFVGKKTNTRFAATPKGRKAFESHLKTLEQLISSQK